MGAGRGPPVAINRGTSPIGYGDRREFTVRA